MRSHAFGQEAAIKVCMFACRWVGVIGHGVSSESRSMPSQLLSLLGDPILSTAAAEGFQLILSDLTDVLNRRCQANIRVGGVYTSAV